MKNTYATFTTENGLCLTDSGECICNFSFVDVSLIKKVDENISEFYVRFKLIFQNGFESDINEVLLSNIDKVNWSNVNRRCLINPNCRRANSHISYVIKEALSELEEKTEYIISKPGFRKIDDIPMYLLGDYLIQPVHIDQTTFKVEINPTHKIKINTCRYDEQQATGEIIKLVELFPSGNILLAFLAMNLMRSAFEQAEIPPNFILYLKGSSGFKKTTISSIFANIYEDEDQPSRLNASIPAATKLLYIKNDCLMLLDDLFPSNIQGVKSQQEKTMTEIVRIIGDGTPPARMSGKEIMTRTPRCGVLMTGEYDVPANPSTLARMITIDFTTIIDNAKLNEFQKQPQVIQTFIYYFLQWYINEYHDIVKLINDKKSKSRNNNSGSGIHPRLQAAQLCLEIACELLMQYFLEKKFTSKDSAAKRFNAFKTHITKIIQNQNERIQQADRKSINYLEIIINLYKDEKFVLGKSPKGVRKHKSDGFCDKKYLYLRSENMLKKIQEIDPTASFNKIKSSLDSQNALAHYSDGKTLVRDNMRFYAIFKDKLK